LPDAASDGGAATDVDAGGTSCDPDSVWTPLTVMAVASPMDHGAVGDGVADDLAALGASVNALPEAGGIVYLPAGKTFRKNDLLVITKAHVKLWAPNRQAEILGSVVDELRRPAHAEARSQRGRRQGHRGPAEA